MLGKNSKFSHSNSEGNMKLANFSLFNRGLEPLLGLIKQCFY